jgi:hypothetical protein
MCVVLKFFDHNLIAFGAGERIRRLLFWNIQQELSDFLYMGAVG